MRLAIQQLSFLQALRHMWAEPLEVFDVSCKNSNYVGKQSKAPSSSLIAGRYF